MDGTNSTQRMKMVKDVRECEMVRDRNALPNAKTNGLTSPSDREIETPTVLMAARLGVLSVWD